MTFRTRLLIAFLLAVLVPMIVLALFIRGEMTDRLTGQYERRVESLIHVIEDDLTQEGEALSESLAILRKTIANDNRFRQAAVDADPEERRYLLNYAGIAMQLTGLTMLQVQDESGRIISSGHFRNEYDRLEPALPALLHSVAGAFALVQARSADEPFVALARVDSVEMGNRTFTVIAGFRVEDQLLVRLARHLDVVVTLSYPGGTLSSATGTSNHTDGQSDEITRRLILPFIGTDRAEVTQAMFEVSHDLSELRALRRSIDRWFAVAIAAAALMSIALVTWLASRISRPLMELADKTSRIDLDRLDIEFDTQRRDEIGVLSRLLGAMTERLRASAVHIKDAERRATLGDMARQVNHDIKNGLTPIRNVFRHLAQLSSDEPARMPDVFQERRGSLDSSISYLESLASHYERISTRSERRPCDVDEIVRRVAADLQGTDGARLQTVLGGGTVVLGDPLSLRRILENLIDNAIDSLGSEPGNVTISTERVSEDADRAAVRVTVADTGAGMSAEVRDRVFDDFFTTKADGTGLGLSIVRRLVMDLDGSIRVDSEEGAGSRFVIEFPAGA